MIFYTKPYLVSYLRSLLGEWITRDVYDEFRGRIVDAIQGHSEADRVSVRLNSDQQIHDFESLAAREDAT